MLLLCVDICEGLINRYVIHCLYVTCEIRFFNENDTFVNDSPLIQNKDILAISLEETLLELALLNSHQRREKLTNCTKRRY